MMFIAPALGLQAQERKMGQIKAAAVRGEVTAVLPDGQKLTVANKMKLPEGAVVTTGAGASVVLVFANGATVNLGEDTQMVIEVFKIEPHAAVANLSALAAEPSSSVTSLRLNRGELVSDVKKLNLEGGSEYTINTPVGAAGIRGTIFRIVFRPTGDGKAFFSLITQEGEVRLSGTVAVPADVKASEEITVNVDVDADNNLISNPTTFTVTTADSTSEVQINAAIQSMIESALETEFESDTDTGANTGTGTSDNGNAGDDNGNGNTAPPVVTPPVKTTPGDGTT